MSDKSDNTGKTGAKKAKHETDMEHSAKLSDKAPPEGLRALALDYPLALIAGGIVAGVVIGSFLPRSNTGRLGKSIGALAGIAGEYGLSYARKAMDGVSEAAETGGKVAGAVGERASNLLGSAGDAAGTYSGKAAETAENAVATLRNSAEGLARQVIRLTSQLRH